MRSQTPLYLKGSSPIVTEPAPAQSNVTANVVTALSDIDAAAWQACLPDGAAGTNPFVSYAFLNALESTDCVGPTGTGWLPHHICLETSKGSVIAVAPTYVKLHSRGEFVFDHAWAAAAHRAGQSYYPKLQVSVPFTPVPGPRLLVRPDQDRHHVTTCLASALVSLTERVDASSVHLTFLQKDEWDHLGDIGFLQRIDQQFHWHNSGYTSFDDFLATLSSRKRKTIRKERRQSQNHGLSYRTLRGDDIRDADWDAFYRFYMDTSARKWGDAYLNRAFFAELSRTLSDSCILILAFDDETPVAGALHLLGSDCLYGRYWGSIDYHPFLHFELCYYQAMDFAIANGVSRVEAGAQGEHKLLRGYVPTPTYSAHWIADPGLRQAVARYLSQERVDVLQSVEVLTQFVPYKAKADKTAP